MRLNNYIVKSTSNQDHQNIVGTEKIFQSKSSLKAHKYYFQIGIS